MTGTAAPQGTYSLYATDFSMMTELVETKLSGDLTLLDGTFQAPSIVSTASMSTTWTSKVR